MHLATTVSSPAQDWIGSFVTTLFIPVLAAVIATIRARRHPASDRAARLDVWLRWWFGLAFGVGALWIGIAFLVAEKFFATSIGYQQSGFQTEIAFCNLGFAVIGLAAVRITDHVREVGALGYLVFLWGAAAEHIHTAIADGNHRAGNIGGIIPVDIAVPLIALLLARARRRLDAPAR